MTRINVGIEPRELPSKLLIAEHREITRIPNAVRTGRAKVIDIPASFMLGTGHVKFFYDKLQYLADRYANLYAECCNRGFAVTNKSTAFDGLPAHLMRGYNPTTTDRDVLVARIRSKGFELLAGKNS